MNTPNPDPVANLLIVDDVPANLQLLAGIFKRQNYKVRPAPSGELALRAAREQTPDLILLDINMPVMSGYEVCEQLKADETLKSVPIIFISALNDVLDKVRAFDVGGADYVTKPFHAEEVVSRVRTHLALRRQERQLQESLARLKELERLRDNLVHMIVHDMRSPLTAILSSLEMLQVKPPLDPGTMDTFLQLASRAGAGLNRMTTQLLDISRLEAGRMPLLKEKQDLRETLRAAMESMTSLAGERSILLDAQGQVFVLYDRDIVGRVATNLLANALKFTDLDGRIELAIVRHAGFVRVAVADNGPGIAAEHHHKIFEKFSQAELSDKQLGTGLGLTFCKLAVEAHGGCIGVESVPGQGSLFWFTLPLGMDD
jgi:signal transduction histidine kinase